MLRTSHQNCSHFIQQTDVKNCLNLFAGTLCLHCSDMKAAQLLLAAVVALFGLSQEENVSAHRSCLCVPAARRMHRLHPPSHMGLRERKSCRRVHRSDQQPAVDVCR